MILQVINSLNTGGAEKFVVEITTQFKKTGHLVEVLTFERKDTPFAKELKQQGIPIRYTASEKYLSPLNLFTFVSIIFSNKYKVIHAHLTYAQLWLSIASLLNFGRKRLFTTEHSAQNNRRASKLLRVVDKFIFSRFDKVISISSSVEQQLMAWVKPRKRDNYVVIPNCVNIDNLNKALATSRLEFGIDSNAKVVTMVGRMNTPKDQPTVIKAVESLPNEYVCLLVGDGPTLCSVKQTVNQKGRTIFTGARSDVASLIKMSDIYVQSSLWEGMPTTILEAMACGCVVLGSNVDGVRDILPDEQLFEQGNYQQLASMIEQMTTEHKNAMIEKQNQFVKSYSVENITNKILSLYA